MKWWRVLIGVVILLYQQSNAKPVKRRQQTESTELIREKREDLEEDEGSDEMQKFILDLSAKEDMRRLKERFKPGKTRDVEGDDEYRRLKRFSVKDDQDDGDEESTSGKVTMDMRSSRTVREDEEATGPDDSQTSNTTMQSTYVKHNAPAGLEASFPKHKRSISMLAGTLSKWMTKATRNTKPVRRSIGGLKPDAGQEPDEENDEPEDFQGDGEADVYEDRPAKEFGQAFDSPESEDDSDGRQEERRKRESREDTAADPNAGSHVNYHLVGRSWELVHHDPSSPSGSLPSNSLANTTVQGAGNTTGYSNDNTVDHSEYLQDDVLDDIDQYKRIEKSRRKPRLSKIKVIRSIEPEYEVQEISAVYDEKARNSDDDSAHVIALDRRTIRSDGYIGCFVDQHPNRDLVKAFSVSDLTPDSCRSVCKEKGHAYAGVQYGYLCHCGDDYGKYGHAVEKECNSVCQGDQTKRCGGFWRNSIYAADIFGKAEEKEHGEDDERKSRSHIDRIIPLSESEEREEIPVRQEITAYLRAYVPTMPAGQHAGSPTKGGQQNSSNTVQTGLKRGGIPQPAQQKTRLVRVDHIAYLHPQHVHRSFIPSNVVLKTLKAEPGKRTYTGAVKLKQNWHDNLKNRDSPKTLILAGNIKSAFTEMFATDHNFEKADVLGFREASIRNDPSTVHKVLVEFALTFKKGASERDKKLRQMVENSGRLDDMPVFADTIQVKEYNHDSKQDSSDSGSENSDSETEVRKNTRDVPVDSQTEEDKPNKADPFLKKVFSQIRK